MSVETPKVEEVAPVTKPVEATPEPVPAASETPVAAPEETIEPAAPAVQEPAKTEAVVEAVPASEGVLGYKEPGFLHQFRFSKNFFWFSDEPASKETLTAYVRSEKGELAHQHAAWAQETGKGVLFYAKRAEDKATPSGLILLAEAANVVKSGWMEFSFKVGEKTHKFEAANQQERDSWLVAIEKKIEESKGLKEDITNRESYKKALTDFVPVVVAPATGATKTETPKKSLDATTATAAASEPTATPAAEDKKVKDVEQKAKKERSQSRKRNSVFNLFKKDEEKDVTKDETKTEKKAEKEIEKEEAKAEKEAKKAEAEQKKEEAKAEHDASKAKEAVEAAAVAAAPVAVIAAADKKEEKTEEKGDKTKRTSVFGGLFGKNKVTSPTAEKAEKDVAPATPAKDAEVPPVSETAPKLDEPIENKPIDTAAVTAPVDAAEPSVAVASTEQAPKVEAPVATADAATTPKAEKKGGFLSSLIKKKDEKKEETKEEKAAEEISKDPLAAASVEPAAPETAETPAKEAEAVKDEREPREKRRTSFFGSLQTLKRKTDKSPEPSAAADESTVTKETKREKSPLPAKLNGLFRKPSKGNAISSAAKSETPVADATKTEAETPKVNGEIAAATEAQPTVTTVEPTESAIVGDVVPEELHTPAPESAIKPVEEIKASA